MVYFFIVLNALLGVLITAALLPEAGAIVLLLDIFMLTIGCNTIIGDWFIAIEYSRWGDKFNNIIFSNKRLLMSIACLTFSLKAASILAIVLEIVAGIVIAFVLCLVSFGTADSKDYEDGCAGSFAIGRFLFKLLSLISTVYDKIAMIIAKIELYCLGIQIPK